MTKTHLQSSATKVTVSSAKSQSSGHHSSLWETQRSRRICEIAQYNWIVLPLLLAIVYPFIYRLFNDPENSYFYFPVDDTVLWNRGAAIWLLTVLPSKPLHHLSMLATCWPCRPFRLLKQPTKRSFNRLLICLVTRGEQPEVVQRSLKPVQDKVARIDPRVSLHILTEERNVGNFHGRYENHVGIHGVPGTYVPRVARHKARSMEWFRINMELQDDDWVLHIDEETMIDEYVVQKCIDFITRQDHDEIGTGVIHFNIEGYWSSMIPAIGDLSRVQDDWGRCQFSANVPHQATLGIHGAFFLSSGKVENAVTWETAHLTEDYWFLLGAMRKGFRIGWVPAIAREVSPHSIGDYLRQRRRWYTGIRTLGQPQGIYVLLSWLWAYVAIAFEIWKLCVGGDVDPVPRWLFCFIVFEAGSFKLFTSLTVLLQDWDAQVSLSSMIYHQVMAQLLRPFVNLLDAYAVAASLLFPDKGFYIVQKG